MAIACVITGFMTTITIRPLRAQFITTVQTKKKLALQTAFFQFSVMYLDFDFSQAITDPALFLQPSQKNNPSTTN